MFGKLSSPIFLLYLHSMPILSKIVVKDFRNVELQELNFSPRLNCISGDNGEGKTNLLEAVWYLSMTKSSFSTSDRFVIRHGCSQMSLAGTYVLENGTSAKIALQTGEGGKILKRDDKPLTKISEHIGFCPVVMVSPSDTALVSEGGEERRRFVNAVLSQMDRQYLSDMQNYNRLLENRNMVLKQPSPDDAYLDAVDVRLSDMASRIYEARKRFAADLEPVVKEFYSRISGAAEEAGVTYHSDLDKAPLQQILSSSRSRDKMQGFTGAGIQRDDFFFTLNSHPIRKYGSQGQQKSFLVSLKFAQYEIMKARYGYPPLLLLDDLFDKLDMKRVANLLQMVSGTDFGQIFLTDSSKVRIDTLLEAIDAPRACFTAKGGAFSAE